MVEVPIEGPYDLDFDPSQYPIAALNEIGAAWPDSEEEPDEINLEFGAEIADSILESFREYFDRDSGSALSRREAQIYHLTRPHSQFESEMTVEGVAACLMLGGYTTGYLSPEKVQSIKNGLRHTFRRAREVHLAGVKPEHEGHTNHSHTSRFTVVDQATWERLALRSDSYDRNKDALIRSLLDDTQDSVSLRKIGELYRDKLGASKVVVELHGFGQEHQLDRICINSDVPSEAVDNGPEELTSADAVEVGDATYPLVDEEQSSSMIHYEGCQILYLDESVDEIGGQQWQGGSVSIETGIRNVIESIDSVSEFAG